MCGVAAGDAAEFRVVVFGGVELTHIDIDKAHVGVLEGGFGGRGKVAVARTNANYHVGVAGNPVGGKGPRHADRPGGAPRGERADLLAAPEGPPAPEREREPDERGRAEVAAAASVRPEGEGLTAAPG